MGRSDQQWQLDEHLPFGGPDGFKTSPIYHLLPLCPNTGNLLGHALGSLVLPVAQEVLVDIYHTPGTASSLDMGKPRVAQ
jgi:hypothetical protein